MGKVIYAVATDEVLNFPRLLAGTLDDRPEPAISKRVFLDILGPVLYMDTGVEWKPIGAAEAAAQILSKLLTVDGAGSGLDADLLDGLQATDFVRQTEKGQANGVAPLVSGLVPEQHIPAVAIGRPYEVASQAAMLALGDAGTLPEPANVGDVAIRSDVNKSFMLRAAPASTLANWAELRTPTDAVLSVDGRTGAVSLSDLYASINDARLRQIRDEGVALTNRAILDFTGAGVVVTDDGPGGRTQVNISGAAAGAATETAAGIGEIATDTEIQTVLDTSTFRNFLVSAYRLRQELDRRFTLPAWIAPTLLNGWLNFGSPNANAGYYKDAQGFVILRGLIKDGTMSSAAFNLPAGYRPASTIRFAAASQSLTQPATVVVDASGNVTPQTGNNVFFSLDTVRFRAEA